MNCVTCSAAIPPAFVHAIQTNVCPGCAGPIMPEESKQIMDELREAMVKMEGDPVGLSGWLLSNYDMRKKGSVEPTEFHKRKENIPQNGQLKIASPAAQRFMQLAGADKVVSNPKAAALIAAINSVENQPDPFQETEDEIVEPSPEEEFEEAKAQIQAAQKVGKKLTARDLLANNTTFDLGAKRGLDSNDAQAVQDMWGGGKENVPANIQADRMKRLFAQQELNSGASVGKIKR